MSEIKGLVEHCLAGKTNTLIMSNCYLCGLDFKSMSIIDEEEECMCVGTE